MHYQLQKYRYLSFILRVFVVAQNIIQSFGINTKSAKDAFYIFSAFFFGFILTIYDSLLLFYYHRLVAKFRHGFA